MDVALWERDYDAVFTEGVIDGKANVAGDSEHLVCLGDEEAQFEVEGAFAEVLEQDKGLGPGVDPVMFFGAVYQYFLHQSGV